MVLGKAKVISYKDLEEVRAKRAVKEKAIAGKGKRGLKRKSPTPGVKAEIKVQAGSPKVITDSSVPKEKVARMSEIKPAKILEALWRASVARMY